MLMDFIECTVTEGQQYSDSENSGQFRCTEKVFGSAIVKWKKWVEMGVEISS